MTTANTYLPGRLAGFLMAALLTFVGVAQAQDTATGADDSAIKAEAARQILQSAYLRHLYVSQRLETAQANKAAYEQQLENERTAIGPYKAAVTEKTDEVRALRDEVEGTITAIKDKYDGEIMALREKEFDLQDQLNNVGELEYLPRKEAERQTRIAALRVQQRDVREQIRMTQQRMNNEVNQAATERDQAIAELRQAEKNYVAAYQSVSNAEYQLYQAEQAIDRFSAEVEPAAKSLEEAKENYAQYGDPQAVIASTTVPNIATPSHTTASSDDTIVLMRQMLADFQTREVEERQAAIEAKSGTRHFTVDLDGDGDLDAPSLGDTVNIAGHEVNPLHVSVPVTLTAILIIAAL